MSRKRVPESSKLLRLAKHWPDAIADVIGEYAESTPREKLDILLAAGPAILGDLNIGWRCVGPRGVLEVRFLERSAILSRRVDDSIFYVMPRAFLDSIVSHVWHLSRGVWMYDPLTIRPFTPREIELVDDWMASVV